MLSLQHSARGERSSLIRISKLRQRAREAAEQERGSRPQEAYTTTWRGSTDDRINDAKQEGEETAAILPSCSHE